MKSKSKQKSKPKPKHENDGVSRVRDESVAYDKWKKRELAEFLERYRDLPEQGTDAWKLKRARDVGGSEFNEMQTNPAALIARKIGLSQMPDLITMKFGTMFEPVARDLMSRILATEIYEASSIPSAEVARKSFSMDGIAIVKFLCDRWNDKAWDFRIALTTLFEFKSLYSRKIVRGVVYKPYVPQVLSGMSDIPIVDVGLYVETVPRICRFEELGNNPECETWLQRDPNPDALRPMSYGFLGFYKKDWSIPDTSRDTADNGRDPYAANTLLEWMQSGRVHDFAKLENSFMLNRLFRFAKSGDIGVWYSRSCAQSRELARCDWFATQRVTLRDEHVDMDGEFRRFTRLVRDNGYIALGVLGYKIIDMNVVTVEKQPGYTKRFEPEIRDFADKLDTLLAIPDYTMRVEAYKKMFPGRIPEPEPEDTVDRDESDALMDMII